MSAPSLRSGDLHRRQLDHAQREVNPHGRGRQPLRITKAPKPTLWVDKKAGTIGYGQQLLLAGIPADAWRYQLGNRSALEWVVDQYKDRTPKDPTIRAEFDTYRVADHLEELTLLLRKVITVSMKTMRIVDELAAASPFNPQSTGVHQAPAPTTAAAAKQLLFDFSQPEPLGPPETFTLRLHRGQSEFYLEYDNEEHGTTALKYLLQAFGHEWDKRVASYTVTEYWQGPKQVPGSWIAALVVAPC